MNHIASWYEMVTAVGCSSVAICSQSKKRYVGMANVLIVWYNSIPTNALHDEVDIILINNS